MILYFWLGFLDKLECLPFLGTIMTLTGIFSLQVLKMLRKRGECSGENFDTVGLLQTLYLVKMDTVDAKRTTDAQAKLDEVKIYAAEAAAKNNHSCPIDTKTETEMQGKCNPCWIYRSPEKSGKV